METERCKITLNNDKNIYYSGETISGVIVLNSKKPRKIRGRYHILYYKYSIGTLVYIKHRKTVKIKIFICRYLF